MCGLHLASAFGNSATVRTVAVVQWYGTAVLAIPVSNKKYRVDNN